MSCTLHISNFSTRWWKTPTHTWFLTTWMCASPLASQQTEKKKMPLNISRCHRWTSSLFSDGWRPSLRQLSANTDVQPMHLWGKEYSEQTDNDTGGNMQTPQWKAQCLTLELNQDPSCTHHWCSQQSVLVMYFFSSFTSQVLGNLGWLFRLYIVLKLFWGAFSLIECFFFSSVAEVLHFSFNWESPLKCYKCLKGQSKKSVS